MGAAFLAPGETLVDAVAIGLVGDDENAAVGVCGGGEEQKRTGNEYGRKSHWVAPIGRRTAPRNGLAGLIDPESGTSKALTASF